MFENYLAHANDDNILYGTINVLVDKTNNTYKPFYPRTRKDLVVGIENVDNTADANKSVSYAVSAGKAMNDKNGNDITTTYRTVSDKSFDTNSSDTGILLHCNEITKGEAPNIKQYYYYMFKARNAVNYPALGGLEQLVTPSNESRTAIFCTRNVDSKAITYMGIIYPSEGDPRGFCPIPTDLTSNNDTIPTTAWIRNKGLTDSYISHNAMYRGYDLTAYFNSGQMSADIAAGNWSNIYPGDYITKTISAPAITYTNNAGTTSTYEAETYTNCKWLVLGLNSYIRGGISNTDIVTNNHIVLFPDENFTNGIFFNTSTYTGYVNTDTFKYHIPRWETAIRNAFGANHVLKHNVYLSDSFDSNVINYSDHTKFGAVVSNTPIAVYCNLLCASAIANNCFSNNPFERSIGDVLPLFKLGFKIYKSFCTNTYGWDNSMVYNYLGGYLWPSYIMHHTTSWVGIRPYFLLY